MMPPAACTQSVAVQPEISTAEVKTEAKIRMFFIFGSPVSLMSLLNYRVEKEHLLQFVDGD
jgi:hypothetical protein